MPDECRIKHNSNLQPREYDMRFVEISNGIPAYITNEEASVSADVDRLGKVTQSGLSEQYLDVVNRLVSKNVLTRRRNGKDVYYVRNKSE